MIQDSLLYPSGIYFRELLMFAHEREFVQWSDQSDPTFCFGQHHFKPLSTSLYHHHYTIVRSIFGPNYNKNLMTPFLNYNAAKGRPWFMFIIAQYGCGSSSRGQKGYNICKRIWPHGQAWSNFSYECVVVTSTIHTLWLGQYVLGSKNCPLIKCQSSWEAWE